MDKEYLLFQYFFNDEQWHFNTLLNFDIINI